MRELLWRLSYQRIRPYVGGTGARIHVSQGLLTGNPAPIAQLCNAGRRIKINDGHGAVQSSLANAQLVVLLVIQNREQHVFSIRGEIDANHTIGNERNVLPAIKRHFAQIPSSEGFILADVRDPSALSGTHGINFTDTVGQLYDIRSVRVR